jgi:hypothetical protein
MKEENNKKKNSLSQFQRYVRGEMTKREENAFQRKLQRDPFAAEAAEGFSEISPREADEDMKRLGKKFKNRITGRKRMIYYRIAASVAVLMIISSVFLFVERNKPAGELGKGPVAPAPKEETDSKQFTEPLLAESENVEATPEVLAEQEKKDEINDNVISAVTEDTVFAETTGALALAEKQDSTILITSDQIAAPAAARNEVLLAEYKEETKNAMAAGTEAAKAAYMEAAHTPPQPASGKESFDKYIEENIRRPGNLAVGDSAGVVISFIVRITGIIDNIKVLSSPGDEFSIEAKRLIMEGPAWNPAISNGEKIDDEISVRITFK